MFLDSFLLPDAEAEERMIMARMSYNSAPRPYIDNTYPCLLFPQIGLSQLHFERITILYGGNGSGKSTLLNVIARRLGLERTSPGNSAELFQTYAEACRYTLAEGDEGERRTLPAHSSILTSDDVFEYMLAMRTNNQDIAENIETARQGWQELKFGDTVKLRGMEDYDALRLQVLARSKSVSRRQFVRRTAGLEAKLRSNGETALAYFREHIRFDTLCCLDEPENSLSPRLQLQLAEFLEQQVRYGGCQLILATHSPFLLALPNARIYDLDDPPVTIKNWYELENVRSYHAFFKKHEGLFEKD